MDQQSCTPATAPSGADLVEKDGQDTELRKPAKGKLIFDSNFESGNLLSADETVKEAEYEIKIRPDKYNSRYRVWFYFSVRNVRKKQVVLFNCTNFSKGKSLYRDGMSPLVKSTSREYWQRLPSRSVYYYKCPRHKMNYVLSFVFEFDSEEDTYWFAYSFPYTYGDLQQYLHTIDKLCLPFYKRELLCRTLQHRRVDIVTIGPDGTAEKGYSIRSNPSNPRRLVFISARVHPGESPASYMCHGLIDLLLSSEPAAVTLRKNVTFMVVPMINPDGVYNGNYRCSLSGNDLNRQWESPSIWCHPENYHIKQILHTLTQDPGISLDFVIDMHAHSTSMNAFCFVNLEEDFNKMQRELHFLRLLDANSRMFSLSNTRICCDPSKYGTGRRSLPEVVGEHTHCYTLEVSFFCYQTPGARPTPFTQQGFMEMGKSLCTAFVEYYKLGK